MCSASRPSGFTSGARAAGKLGSNWFKVSTMDELSSGIKAVILANENAYVLVASPVPTGGDSSRSTVYCVEANSTAYKYPLADAGIDHERKTITSALDGTEYSLETGEVLTWCPKDNPIRFVLGSLKERERANLEQHRLKVFPVEVLDNGEIWMVRAERRPERRSAPCASPSPCAPLRAGTSSRVTPTRAEPTDAWSSRPPGPHRRRSSASE